jgi:hypothetical protein
VRREDGVVVAEFAYTVAFWLLPMAILVVSLPTWVERQSLARLAAQEAAREVALADDWAGGVAEGQAIVDQLAANHDVPPDDVSVSFSGSLSRGAEVSAAVTVLIPAISIPLITDVPAFSYTSTHSELVDRYRSFP